jgi:hypothetical protein
MDQLIRNRYNPEYFHSKAIEVLDTVSKDEAEAWYNHPCTASIRYSLEGDISGILIAWVGGAYSDEASIDTTAQLEAKARGMAQAAQDIIEHLDNIKQLRVGDINE